MTPNKIRDQLALPLERSWKDSLRVYQYRIGILLFMMVCFVVLLALCVFAWHVAVDIVPTIFSYVVKSTAGLYLVSIFVGVAVFAAISRFLVGQLTVFYRFQGSAGWKGFSGDRTESGGDRSLRRLARLLAKFGCLWSKRVRESIWDPATNDLLALFYESSEQRWVQLGWVQILTIAVRLALQTAFVVALDFPFTVVRKRQRRARME